MGDLMSAPDDADPAIATGHRAAYEAVQIAVAGQTAALEQMRNRAIGLLTVAGALTAFAAAVGLLPANWSPGTGRNVDAAYLLLTVAAIALTGAVVALPTGHWNWGIGEAQIEDLANVVEDSERTYQVLFEHASKSYRDNKSALGRKAWWFRLGTAALVAQFALLVFLT
jgi:hypothetical protein